MPGMMPPGAPPMPAPSSTGEVQPLPVKVASVTAAGVAADQPAGTDSPPTADASPMPAIIAAPPAGEVAPASVVPKPKPAPSGAASPMVTPNGAPARKWPVSGNVALIIATFHASVTPML